MNWFVQKRKCFVQNFGFNWNVVSSLVAMFIHRFAVTKEDKNKKSGVSATLNVDSVKEVPLKGHLKMTSHKFCLFLPPPPPVPPLSCSYALSLMPWCHKMTYRSWRHLWMLIYQIVQFFFWFWFKNITRQYLKYNLGV